MKIVVSATLVIVLGGCEAAPPPHRDAGSIAAGQDRFVSFASCSAAAGGPEPCPGELCWKNAVGPPDGQTVSLGRCRTFDATFTGGTVYAAIEPAGGADIVLHVVPPLSGTTRIEASSDGVSYVLIGFLDEAPLSVPPGCRLAPQGDRVPIDLGACNHISNVSFLRLTEPNTAAMVIIDAIEASSFQARR